MTRDGKILIVDDSAENRLLLKALVTANTAYACTEASGGESALAVLEGSDTELPDLVLLDIMMPGMDGYAVAQRLKASPRTRDIPIIFITALDDMESRIKGFGYGGADYLGKPFNKGELLARINAHLALKRLTDELKDKNRLLSDLNRELASRNGELGRLNDQKNQLIGLVAHDLRNPLAVIMGVTQLLEMQLEEKVTDRQKTHLARVRLSSNLMLNIINNLLDIEMIESGRLTLQPVPTDLGGLLRQCVELNNFLSEYKEIKITLNCPEPAPRLRLDPPRIEQVMNNLLSNAVKYSRRGSAVRVMVTTGAADVEIVVADEGQGIPPDELETIFRPFSMATPKPTGGEKSVGLGLAIVKRIVDAHQGDVAVESRPGRGTTFRVFLPLA